MLNRTAREGDFIETREGLIFDVKGLVHPPDRTIAFLRYYPSETGTRQREGCTYTKVYNLEERFKVLHQKYPQFLYEDPIFGRRLQGVPLSSIRHVYQPTAVLEQLQSQNRRDSLQEDVVTFAKIIQQASQVSPKALGISGSILVNLHQPDSDIDLIVYGRQAAERLQAALKRIHQKPDQNIAGYSRATYQPIYDLRWKGSGISFEEALQIDGPKAMHGTYRNRHYFIRAILDWDELEEKYGDRRYRQIGYAQAQVLITDHADGLFTPCRYEIEEVNLPNAKRVREIVSFRGRFSEHVQQGDVVIVRGTLEEVITKDDKWARFLLGNTPEDLLISERLA
ncbi:MAG: nucleotidyltransferase domain-containing protein [Promethearchaeota archaeon]